MKNVLFVDDEPLVLKALQRLLWPMRRELAVSFATSGKEALEKLSTNSFDVFVTDMRMPGMDGAELLGHVRDLYPDIIRITLSGEIGSSILGRALPVAHRFLTKPCEPELLRNTIMRACELRSLLESSDLRKMAAGLKVLPSLPKLYREIVAELESPDPSMQNVANIISRDVAMTLKLIQVANSPIFGRRYPAVNIGQAVIALGIEMTRNLVLAGGLFSGFSREAEQTFELEKLWEHCRLSAELARTIAETWNVSPRVKQDAATSGFLHEVGRLVFAASVPDQYARVLKSANKLDSKGLLQAEREEFGETHAALGAYILGLWGIPEAVIESVAWHHSPGKLKPVEASAMVAVQIAEEILDASEENRPVDIGDFDGMVSQKQIQEWSELLPAMKHASPR